MSLTVADVLELEVLRRAEPEILAGHDQLSRTIRWVHIFELPDVGSQARRRRADRQRARGEIGRPLLKGGELLLSTGLGMGDSPEQHRSYLSELTAINAAGLVVELGRSWSALPDDVISGADSVGLPLIALHREVRFVEITEEVHAAILNHQYGLLVKAERIGRDFTSSVLRGDAADRIVEQLAGFVENPVIFEDPAHQVIEGRSYAHAIDEMLDAWPSHTRSPHRTVSDSSAIEMYEGTPRCARIPVHARDEVWGWLHVVELDSPLDAIDLLAIDRAAAAVGLTLLSEESATQLSANARGALIADILQARHGSSAELIARARALGANFEGRNLFAIEVQPQLAEFVFEHRLSERNRQRLRNQLLGIVTKAIDSFSVAGISGPDGDRILSLIGLPMDGNERKVLDSIAEAVERGCVDVATGLDLTIGVSRQVTPSSLLRGFEEASEAVRFGFRMGTRRVQYFDDLGFHKLLLRLSDAELAQFAEAELQPLLEHDANSAFPLLVTLRAYLDHGGNKSATAKALYIERRSLYHRLDRIAELLGRDIDDPHDATQLLLAVRSLDLLQGRRTATPPR